MIKTIKKFQIKLTPFEATKDWKMSNINNQDVLLMDTGSNEDDPVALEFIDYGEMGQPYPIINSECDIALEQQPDDLVKTRLGLNIKGIFYPDIDPVNVDGTYKRIVYTQVKTTFYNDYRDPTKIWGIDTLDFELSKTKRYIVDELKLFDIPRLVYGEKIIPNTIEIKDNSIDDNVKITDDGNGNLIAGTNLFSIRQEVGNHQNKYLSGSNSSCDNYFDIIPPYTPQNPPLIITQPQNQIVQVGNTASFFVNAIGTLPLSYQWISGSTNLVDNSRITGSNSSFIIINNVQIGDIGYYKVFVSNIVGNVYSNTASLSIAAPSPSDYPLMAWWRASDLTLSVGTPIESSTNWKTIVGNYTASGNVSSGPTYEINQNSSQPGVVFNGINQSLSINPPLDFTSAGHPTFAIAVVCHASIDGIIFGNSTINMQIRKFRIGANDISMYGGPIDNSDRPSSIFSSSASQPVVCWWQHDMPPEATFYENKYNRGGPASWVEFENVFNEMGATSFGGYTNASISEICIWSSSINQTAVTNLFDNYFKPRYPNVFYTGSA
jgi:hypothetical protein